MSQESTIPIESRITSMDEVRNKACQIVPLPGWEPGDTFNAKLRRASLLSLVQQGVVPNQLLPLVYKIINEKGTFNPLSDSNPEEFMQFLEMLNAICKAVLVDPPYEEVGEYLTDVQRTAIFLYAQQGVRALESFRKQQGDAVASVGDSQGVRRSSK